MTDKPAITRLIKDPRRVRQSVRRLLSDAYRKAKRATRKRHARPMTWRELRDLARVDYQAYLQTDHWRKTRWAACNNVAWTCQECGLENWLKMQVHHLTYKRLGRERMRDLRVLCGGCHGRVHK